MIAGRLLLVFGSLFLLLSIADDADGWLWGSRRRTPAPPPCTTSDWSTWTSCTCNLGASKGTQTRSQTKTGGCANLSPNVETQDCTLDCVLSMWGSWGGCSATCGPGTETRTRTVITKACGGSCGIVSTARKCSIACCPVDCSVDDWTSWAPSSVPCGTTIDQTRDRQIVVDASCGGSACPALKETQKQSGPCCPQDCQFTYGSWSACSNSCGKGTRTRKVTVTADLVCGGQACPTDETEDCVGEVNVNCQVGQWSAYGRCQPTNGVCGAGTMTRTRRVTVAQKCNGNACPSLVDSASCSTCCPVNCVVGAWGPWSGCSSKDCNLGKSLRSRLATTSPSCGGNSCPALSESKDCTGLQTIDCVMGPWSTWSSCSNRCGAGQEKRYRGVTQSAQCGGASCGSSDASRPCTSYSDDRDCTVSAWGVWGSCSAQCAVGSRERSRTIILTKRCRGQNCPSLKDSGPCGLANGGCAHQCNSGACSCNSGFLLNADGRTCRRRDCGAPSASYCPSNAILGTTCKYPTFACNDGTTYEKSCSVVCPSGYKEPNAITTISCKASGVWQPYDTIWCSRISKPPTKISLSSSSVMENVGVGTVIGVLTTTDPNPSDTHTYSLRDDAQGKAKLKGDQLLINYIPNYESPTKSFSVTIRSTDNKGLYKDDSFTVSIIDENETPTGISLSNFDVDENSDTGTVIGGFTTSDPDGGQKHTVTLLDDAGGRFRVVGNQLQVAKSNVKCLLNGGSDCWLDYERLQTHSIKVRSTDNGSPTKYVDKTFMVRLRNVNDRPRNLLLSGYVLKENAPSGTVIGTLSAFNEDVGQTLTYELTNDAGGRFEINQKTNQVVRAGSWSIDYEVTTKYTIGVRVNDNGKPVMSTSKSFTIEILNVNEPPVSISFASTGGQQSFATNAPKVNENSAIGTIVGTLVVYDPDATQKLLVSLVDSAGSRFSVKTSALSCTPVSVNNLKTKCTVPVLVNGVLDYESNSQLAIVVRATDAGSLFTTAKFSVKIIDVNDRPSDVALSSSTIEENKNDAIVGSFMTVDDDPADTFVYTLTNTASGRFYVDGATLKTTANANLNYEIQTKYTIAVRSTDSGSLSRDKQFVVRVTDVNEAPNAVALSGNSVVENSAQGTVVGALSSSDPDNLKSSRQKLAYSIVDSAGGRFEIVNGIVRVALSNARCLALGGAQCKINYEAARSHQITVRATDNGSPPMHRDTVLTVAVTNANDQPRDLSLDTFKVKENEPIGTLVGTLSATDEDAADRLTYQLTDDDGGRFKLSGRQLLKAKSANYETSTSHSVTVKVTDNGSPAKSMSKKFVIEVLNVKEPPVSIHFKDTGGQLSFPDDSPKVNENSALKTVVGIVEAKDEEPGALTLSLDDSAGNMFSLSTPATCTTSGGTVCSTNVLISGSLDYESKGIHRIIVRATDNAGLFVSASFNITVVDVNDQPKDIRLSTTRIDENTKDALVGDLVTIDDDASQTHAYSLVNDAGGRFVVVGNKLYVSKSAVLNYEIATQHTIVIQSTDTGLPAKSITKTFSIQVNDVNEYPTSVQLDRDSVPENSGTGATVGSLSTSDPDNLKTLRQIFNYTILDDAQGRFRLKGNDVQVAPSNVRCLADGGDECVLNYENATVHRITVRVTDNGVPPLSLDYELAIRVSDVNDRPRRLVLSNDYVYENAPRGFVVGRLSASDEDSLQSHAFSLLDDDGGRFAVNGSRLEIVIPPDYETRKVHRVTVEVRDNGNPSLSMSSHFTIDVLDVDEAPFRVNITDDSGQLSFDDDKPRVEENSPRGTVVGKIVSYDYDANDTMTIRLDDDASGRFSLGLVTCKNSTDILGVNTMCWSMLSVAGDIDYEDDAEHDVIVRVADSAGSILLRRFSVDVVDVNDVPHGINLDGTDVFENLNDEIIGCWTTDDADPSHNHTYVLIDDAGGRFVVKGDCIYTSPRANLNFEVQREYNVTVRSTDNGAPSLFLDESFVITVRDVNESPTSISVSNLTIRENSPTSTGIGVVTVIDPDNLGPRGVWQSHVCFATKDAEGRFVVANNTLQVGISDLDYERNSSWSIVVRCRDSGNPPLSNDQEFVVDVLNVNERPEDITLAGGSVKENESPGRTVASFSTVDPDNEVQLVQFFNYSLEGVLPVGYPFVIRGTELITTRSLDFEVNPIWKAIVRSTDSGGLYMTKTFQIDVLNVNDRPSGVRLSGLGSVPENSADGTFVGQLLAEDEDFNDSHTFRVSPDASGNAGDIFDVNSTTGVVSVLNGTALDYEAVNRYILKVVATDSGGLSITVNVTINVTDVNEAPSNIKLDNDEIPENSIKGSVIGKFAVEDPDNERSDRQNHSCILLIYSDVFEILNGLTLVVGNGSLNYEEKRNYSIEIRCFDNGSPVLFHSESFYVFVTDVNESPKPARLLIDTVRENLPPASLVGSVVSFDPDNEFYQRQSLTFILDRKGSSPFVLNGSGLFTTAVLDFERTSSYVVTLTVVDSGSPPMSVVNNVTVFVKDENDQPTDVIFVSNGVNENSPGDTVVGFLKTVDEDRGQNYTYTFTQVTPRFYINGNQLKVSSGANLDYEAESQILINVKSIDSGRPSLSYANDITVVILEVNEPPTEIKSYREDEIAEMSPAGTIVANLTVIDPDANQSHTCRLLNGTEFFTVTNDGITSQLIVADDAVIDYEKTPSIWVILRCSDDGNPSLSLDHSFVVNVVDVNDPITDIVLSGLTSLPENLHVGAVVGTLSPVDEDRGQTYYFNLTGHLASAFTIDNANLQLIVARPIRFDFESLDHPVINLTINVFDDGNPPSTFSHVFFFNVTDINEPPRNASIDGGETTLREDAHIGDVIGIVTSENPENEDSDISYELISVNGVKGSKDFYLVAANSSETMLYLNRSLDYEDVSSFAIEMLATDSDDPPASSFLTLTIDVERTDPCATGSARCHANATCRRLSQTTSTCVCNPGFSETESGVCTEDDECDVQIDWDATSTSTRSQLETKAKVCNYGTCIDAINNYTCTCEPGYVGLDCSENVNECASNPCGSGGECVDLVNGFTCQCSIGYERPYCANIDDCASAPCTRGTCEDRINDYLCACPTDYTGDVCSFSATACNSSNDACPSQTTCVPVITSSANSICVESEHIASVTFATETVEDASFDRHWERWVKDNLNDSVSEVYIVGHYHINQAKTDVHFVALVNNEPVLPTIVLVALCKIKPSASMPYQIGAGACRPPPSTPPPTPTVAARGPLIGSNLTWIIVIAIIGIAICLLIAISTVVYFRSRQRKRRFHLAAAQFPPTPLDDSQTPFSSLAAQAEETEVRNPLYESAGDVRDSDQDQFSYRNPLYLPDGVHTNPDYEAVRDENSEGMLENPLYDSSQANASDDAVYAEPISYL